MAIEIESDVHYIDAESYHGGQEEKITYNFIILEHIRRITKLSANEWRGGFEQEKVKGNIIETVYVPDTRAQYWNAVDALADMLSHDFDKEMKKKEDDIEKEIKEALPSFARVNKSPPVIQFIDDSANEAYSTFKVGKKRKLFRALCQFLLRNGYFEAKAIHDEIG